MPTTMNELTLDLALNAVAAGFDAVFGRADVLAAVGHIMRDNPDVTVMEARLALERAADRALADGCTLALAAV